MLLPFLSAILGILAFLPFDYFWLLGFFYLVPLFIFFIKENKFWRLILGTFIFRFILGLGTVYYTLEPITWISSILIFLGLPISVFVIKKILNFYSFHFPKNSLFIIHYSLFIIIPLLWILFDHLQARFSLLPTYIITAGNVFGSSPFLGLAAIGGLLSLTFFAATINALIAILISKIKFLNSKFIILNSLFIILLIVAGWQISNYQLQKNAISYNNLSNSLKIAVVSTNEKFDFAQFSQIKAELANQKTDLIIFPEDMFNEIDFLKNVDFYQNLSEELGVNLIATFDTIQNNKKYNSAVLFDKNGEIIGIHNKNRLTFIGEYWPFGKWQPSLYSWLRKNNPELNDYAVFNPQNPYFRGEKKLLLLLESSIAFVALICLEIHYPSDLKEYKKMGARFIVNPTSNRWLDIGTKHFLYLTNNLRKIESVWLEIPIISSGVKDFAGIITPDGKTQFINFENQSKNYGIFIGEIRIP